MQDNHASKPSYDKLAKGLRLTFLAAVMLLAAGGGTASVSASTSRALTLAGYVVFALELVLLTAMQAFLLTRGGGLLPSSRRVLAATLAAAPFLAVRTAYGLLEVAEQADARSPWNPLTGSAVAFALMALLPEYVVLAGWVLMGLSIPPRREVGQAPLGNEELTKV